MPAAGEPRAGAGGGEYLLAISAAADRRSAAGGDRRAGGDGGDVSAGGEAVAEFAARAVASCRGAKLAVTYHPAFLLRDPRQKGEAWKDLQMVMAELGLKAPAKKSE